MASVAASTHRYFFLQYQDNAVIVEHYNYTGMLQRDRYREGLKPEGIAFLVDGGGCPQPLLQPPPQLAGLKALQEVSLWR